MAAERTGRSRGARAARAAPGAGPASAGTGSRAGTGTPAGTGPQAGVGRDRFAGLRESPAVELRTSDVARATGGRQDGPDVTTAGVTVDSRAVAVGQLFVPLVAARDGHDFVAGAVAAGAAAYLSAHGPLPGAEAATCVAVADTGRALDALARLARGRVGDRVVGVTGSV